MMKDLISQFRTAHNILLSLNSQRLSFAYLIDALNMVLKEKSLEIKIHCPSQEVKNELISLDPFFQNKFIEKIDKSLYTLKANKRDESLVVLDNSINSTSPLALKFESNISDLSIKDFDLINNSAKYDFALFFGNYSDKQTNQIKGYKHIKKKFLLNNKKSKNVLSDKNLTILNHSNIDFFIELIDSLDFNNKAEVYTLLLSSVLIETNNLTNSITTKYIETVKTLIEKGAVLSISQNFLSKNSIEDLSNFGQLLSKFIRIENDVYLCDLNSNSSINIEEQVNDLLYISKKIKGHKLIIIKLNCSDKSTYYLASRHPGINLSVLKKKYSGSGNKEFYKFSLKKEAELDINEIFDLLNIEHKEKQINKKNAEIKRQPIINPINNQSILNHQNKREEEYIAPMQYQQTNISINDPLKPADNLPKPIFINKKDNTQIPQKSGPLPSATV